MTTALNMAAHATEIWRLLFSEPMRNSEKLKVKISNTVNEKEK